MTTVAAHGMVPAIWVQLLAEDGNIFAATMEPSPSQSPYRVVVDKRTGDVISATMKEGTDLYRWLVKAARQHVSRATKAECS